MKQILVSLAAMVFGFAGSALADDLEFTISNTTGVAVSAIYISNTGTNQWEEDLLGDQYLPSGNEVQTMISDGREICTYDMRIEFSDGDSIEDYAVNLCELGSYSISSAETPDDSEHELSDALDELGTALDDLFGD